MERGAGTDPEAVLAFWEEVGAAGWYAADAAVDEAVRTRFGALWEAAREGGWMDWTPTPRNALALVIVLDQFPRNMFRGDARAFATDGAARTRAKCAIDKGWDKRIGGAMRQFFYLPLEHSESLADQERAVRLFAERMPEAGETLLHARAHREVIRRFGRFPTRNAALGRTDTPGERDFLAAGGYGALVRGLHAGAAATAS